MTFRFFSRRMGPAWLAAILLGLLAAIAPLVERLRPTPLGDRAAAEIHVTNDQDAGIGSLREAIFLADHASYRVRIVVQVPLITLRTPLPPIVNPAGVVLEPRGARVKVDASRLPAGAVFDVAAPNSVIARLDVYGAPEQALLLRRAGARVTNVAIRGCRTGVHVVDAVDDVRISDSIFDGNVTGIDIGARASGVRVDHNEFKGHSRAAIWSVSPSADRGNQPAAIVVADNRFDGDSASIVFFNAAARIEGNTVAGAKTAALLIHGGSGIVQRNRIGSGLGFAIDADALDHATIAGNEIHHNCAGGILVRDARNTDVLSNRVYTNGYGIVMILGGHGTNTIAGNLLVNHVEDGLYVIGASPRIRGNRMMDNRRAGLRLSSLLVGSRTTRAEPLVDANVFMRNGSDAPVADAYRMGAPAEVAGRLPDCSWRLNPVGTRTQMATLP
jgi:nitrous oxidase accessory protein NosD